jgi:hypothetical protein
MMRTESVRNCPDCGTRTAVVRPIDNIHAKVEVTTVCAIPIDRYRCKACKEKATGPATTELPKSATIDAARKLNRHFGDLPIKTRAKMLAAVDPLNLYVETYVKILNDVADADDE